MMENRRLLWGVLASALFLFGSCKDVAAPVVADKITVSSTTLDLVPAETSSLSATVLDASGQPISKTVAWSTSAPKIATVTNGVVTGVGVGTATITAEVDGKSATVAVTVEEGGIIAPAGGTIHTTDGGVQLSVPAAAVVSTSRLLIHPATQFPANTRVVSGTVFELRSTTSSVGFAQPAVLTIRYDPANLGGKPEADLRLFEMAGADWQEIDPSTVNTTAHTVSAPVTGLGVYAILVQVPVALVVVAPDNLVLAAGANSKLTATAKDGIGTVLSDRVITWTTSDSTVAKVDATGLVTAVAPGNAVVSAISEGVSGGSAVRVTAGTAARISSNAGDGQAAIIRTPVSTPPSVIVTDARGFPVSGVAVTFAVTGGGGSITGANATTDASGVARVGSWTLGPAAGSNTLSATASGLDGSPVQFTATATVPPSGPPAVIAIFAGDGQTALPGTAVAIAPAVIVTDATGKPVPGITVTYSIRSGGGSLTGAAAITDVSGIATVGSWVLGSLGGNSLFATLAGVTGSPVIFVANATTTAPPPPPPPPGSPPSSTPAAIAIFAGDGQTAVAGTAVAIPPAVKVTNASGQPVSGAVVSFSIRSGAGSLTGADAVSDANGIATVGSWTMGSVGGNSLFATLAGTSGSPLIFVANATFPAGSGVRIVTFGDSNTDFGFDAANVQVVASYVSSNTLRLSPTAPNSPYQLAGKIEAKWSAQSSKPILAVNHGISATSTGAGRTGTFSNVTGTWTPGAPDAREQVNGVTRFEGEVMGTAYPWSGGEPTNGFFTSGAISRVKAFTPGANDFVYVSMGTNDPGAAYPDSVTAANLSWMIDVWVNSGHSPDHFLLTTLAPIPNDVTSIPAINTRIRSLAASRGVELIDLAARTSNNNGATWLNPSLDNVGDGIHYTDSVRDWIADQVVQYLLAKVPK